MCSGWRHASKKGVFDKEGGKFGNVFERGERRVEGENEEGVRRKMKLNFDVVKVEVVRKRVRRPVP